MLLTSANGSKPRLLRSAPSSESLPAIHLPLSDFLAYDHVILSPVLS